MDLGVSEMIFIFLLALLLFGPKKLPEIGRQIGKFMAEFRRASNEFKSQINDEIRQLELDENRAKPIAAPQVEGTVSNSPAALSTAALAAMTDSAATRTTMAAPSETASLEAGVARASTESPAHSTTPGAEGA